MDENCSETPNTEVGRNSPSKPPRLEFDEVGKVSPNDRAESPDTNCAICLGKLQNKSFTDSCLHQFCFNCLLEWSKVKAECPLCKQSFKSIIHNVRSMEDYEQYHLCPSEPRLPIQAFSLSLSNDENQPRFRYRTTMVSGQPLFGYLQRLEHMMSREIIPPGYLTRHRWSSRRPVGHGSGSGHTGSRRQRLTSPDYPDFIVPGTSGFRRHIYNSNIWVRRVPDITGRFRECSAEFFLNNPAQVHRLVPWLNRELNVLLHGTEHETPHIVAVILELLPQYNIRSQEFRNAMLPYMGERTDHFIHEFYAFGTSPCDMIGYDQICVYGPRFQFSDNDLSDSSSDSDVQIIDVVHISDSPVNPEPGDVPSHNASHTAVGSPIAGPSYSPVNQSALIAVSSGEDSDTSDCQFVGSVKPRHLRTPEVITLDSDQEPENNEANGNSFSELSEGEIDCKPVFNNGSMTLRLHCNGNTCHRSLSILSSSEESSGEEWGLQQRRRVLNRKNKKEKRDRSSPKSKNKEKEVSKKKKVCKEKRVKPIKHWKKKLCRKIESSSSSDEAPVVSSSRKRRIISSSSSDSESDVEHKVDHNYVNPFCKLNRKKGRLSRLKSVVHVKKNTRETDNTPEVALNLKRDSTRGPSICSGSSSRCSTNYSLPSTSSHGSTSYSARIIPNGEYNPRILFRRKRLPSSSLSSSSSSSTSNSTSHKHRHKKVKSRRKCT